LAALEDRFDCFIFDAYGVFYDGARFYDGVLLYMAHLVESGKKVVVLSNSSQIAAENIESYRKKGLLPQVHYTHFVTSGQVCREDIEQGRLPFHGHRFFMIGQTARLFDGIDSYTRVLEPESADFVFITIPYMTHDEVEAYTDGRTDCLPAKADDKGNVLYWNSLSIRPFLPTIEHCVRLGLPAMSANPDFYASEKHLDRAGVTFVVRNGLVAEYYRRAGGQVLEYGKPHTSVYDYVFKQTGQVDRTRTAMIGDTVRTDVLGAVQAGIAPVLCVETGVTADALAHGQTLDTLLEESKINENQLYYIRRVV
jgi:ribonucleotide monophosphatase NagD (HAD superfamily)